MSIPICSRTFFRFPDELDVRRELKAQSALRLLICDWNQDQIVRDLLTELYCSLVRDTSARGGSRKHDSDTQSHDRSQRTGRLTVK